MPVPDISPAEMLARLQAGEQDLWLDVREPYELVFARLEGPQVLYAPISELARYGLEAMPEQALDKEASLIVFCHHGSRSWQVANWLQAQGWRQVYNLAGGIDAYARDVDAGVGKY